MTYPVPRAPFTPRMTDSEKETFDNTRNNLYSAFTDLAKIRKIVEDGWSSMQAHPAPVTDLQRDTASELARFADGLVLWLDGNGDYPFSRFISLYLSDDLP